MKKYPSHLGLYLVMVILIALSASSCGLLKKNETGEAAALEVDSDEYFEPEVLDDSANMGVAPYRASATKLNDILHMNLQVSFDFDSSRLFGKAELVVKPWFYPVDSLILDAKAFDIVSVKIRPQKGNPEALPYKNTGESLRIALDRAYTRDETYTVLIEYVANPEKVSQEGSDAIASAKGLYFINPKGTDPLKPTQIWTQGETESNSCWFPTIDKPNERLTHQISISVADRFKTLSNGLMVSSVKNADGTRTDTWKMDMPHAPYLVMMAIGEYSVIQDKWRNIPVDYYVEKEFEPYARKIFGNTPEMLEFFSKKLGVDFPWPKYAQVVVRDYVSGAMENTTATVFGEFVQQTPAQMVDQSYEDIIAHELFHHWFGDLVTCESWSNLPLNESFATLAEYLWTEYKYGRDEADLHNQENISHYFEEYFQKKVSLIRFQYEKREDMFDRHSYQKGGAVLHMLRKYLGDEAFFEGLKLYLKENQFQSVEIHNLRMAFEKVCGEDLNWFFNQWFFGIGHPYIEASWDFNEADGNVRIHLKQVQDVEKRGLFRVPLDIDIYLGKTKKRTRVLLDSLRQTFVVHVGGHTRPNLLVVDAERALVGRIIQKLSPEEAAWQLQNAPLYGDRYQALDEILSVQNEPGMSALLSLAMRDPFWKIRQMAIEGIAPNEPAQALEYRNSLLERISKDPKSAVRAAAIKQFSELFSSDADGFAAFEKALGDSSAAVQAAAISAMYNQDKEKTIAVVEQLEAMASGDLLASIASIYADAPVAGKMPFLIQAYRRISGPNEKYFFIQIMGKYALSQEEPILRSSIPEFEELAKTAPAWWLRLSAIQVLSEMKSWYDRQADEVAAEIMSMKEKGVAVVMIHDKEVLKASYSKQSALIGASLDKIRAEEKDPSLNRLLNLIGQ